MRISGFRCGMLWSVFFGLLVMGAIGGAAYAADAPAGDREELAIELPEAYYGGTPPDYWSPALEPQDFRDRPPQLVPKGTVLLSREKTVTSSQSKTLRGELSQITDGNKGYVKKSIVELETGVQWVQIDLGAVNDVFGVLVWHFYEEKLVFFDVIVQVSETPDFKNSVTIYNNDIDNSAKQGVGKDKEYVEDYKGRYMPFPQGAKGRYVRLYTNGNSSSDSNFYIEVEVFGKPSAG